MLISEFAWSKLTKFCTLPDKIYSIRWTKILKFAAKTAEYITNYPNLVKDVFILILLIHDNGSYNTSLMCPVSLICWLTFALILHEISTAISVKQTGISWKQEKLIFVYHDHLPECQMNSDGSSEIMETDGEKVMRSTSAELNKIILPIFSIIN